jgi:predicted outer membrane repeat protein
MNARKWSKRAINALAVLVVLALVSMAAPPVAVHAATTRSIGVDNISDGLPLLGCTLREAISIANAGLTGTHDGCTVNQSGSGTPITYNINLPKGGYLYTLAGVAGEDSNLSGDLDITANVHISGWGAGTTIIDGGGKDRVLHICPGGGCGQSVTFTGVAIRNGNAVDYGGGIYNEGDTVTVDSSTISGNTAGSDGGGILNKDDGTLNVLNSSVVSDNTVLGPDGHGGGIYNEDGATTVNGSTVISNTAQHGGGTCNSEGVLTVTVSTIISNTAVGHGGGIYSDSGTVTVNGSAVIHNEAQDNGGGIYNSDKLNVQNGSTVSANTATNNGGGIYNYYGRMTVNGSTISANTATNNGGGIWNRCTGVLTAANSTIGGAGASNTANEGGGIYNGEGTVMVDGSTVSNNGAYQYGGGIYNDVGTVMVDDSTISDNWAAGSGGGIGNGGTLTVQNSTISGNAVSGTACGGGISNGADAMIDGSIISDNWAGAGGGICTSGALTVTDSRILDNTAVYDGGGVSTYANVVGATSVTGSCIMGNSDTSFFNAEAALQTATGNWWGSASGPSGVGPGEGDSVSDNVDYSGFLTEPILGCYHYTYLPLVLRNN